MSRAESTSSPIVRVVTELDYATWHAHLAAKTPVRLVFSSRSGAASSAKPVPPSRRRCRLLDLNLERWLSSLSGSRRRAA
jgi:hypothetical protein